MKTVAVLTSGGDSPGMNACVRAVTKVAISRGAKVVGIQDGYEGLLDGRFRELSAHGELEFQSGRGGTLLGSARSMRFLEPQGREHAAARLAGIDGLIVIGGNGSLTGAHLLSREHGIRVIGVPASIDNDIGCTASAIGVDTALNTIVEACDRISDTASAHRRAFVVEVMGRQCGYLAMAGAIAVGADAVLFREQGRTEAALVDSVAQVIRTAFEGRHKRRVLILKAEGVEIPCTRLVRNVQELLSTDLTGVEIRGTVLGHVVRGGNPSFQDRMIAGRFGLAAVNAVLDGANDEMVAWSSSSTGGTPTMDPNVSRFPLQQVLAETAALIDGTSPVTRRRVQMMEAIEGVLSL